MKNITISFYNVIMSVTTVNKSRNYKITNEYYEKSKEKKKEHYENQKEYKRGQ